MSFLRESHRATTVKREKSEPNKETGLGEMPKGPLQLVVSINTQKVTLFSNGAPQPATWDSD